MSFKTTAMAMPNPIPASTSRGGVTQHLLQPFLGDGMTGKKFLNQGIDPLGVDARLAAHPGGIIQDDHGYSKCQGKNRRVKTLIQAARQGGGGDEGGM